MEVRVKWKRKGGGVGEKMEVEGKGPVNELLL